MSKSEVERLGRVHGVFTPAGLAVLFGVDVERINAAVNRLHLKPVFSDRGDVRLYDAQAMRRVADELAPAEPVTGRLEAVRTPLSRRR